MAASTGKSGRPTKAQTERKKKAAALAAKRKERHAQISVVLFAFAILLTALALIEGESLWGTLHDVLFGAAGALAYAAGPLLFWYAIAFAYGSAAPAPKVVKGSLLFVSVCSAVYIFGAPFAEGTPFTDIVANLYANGKSGAGGGALSALLGWPLTAGCGVSAAKVVIVIIIFVLVMLITGKTIVDLINSFKKPIDIMREKREENELIAEAMELERAQNPQPDKPAREKTVSAPAAALFSLFARKPKFDIDVDVEDKPVVPAKKSAAEVPGDPRIDIPVDSAPAPAVAAQPEPEPEPQPEPKSIPKDDIIEPLPFKSAKKASAPLRPLAAPIRDTGMIDIPLGPDYDPSETIELGNVITKPADPGPAADIVSDVFRRSDKIHDMFTDFATDASHGAAADAAAQADVFAQTITKKTDDDVLDTPEFMRSSRSAPARTESEPPKAPSAPKEYRCPPLAMLERGKAPSKKAADDELRSKARTIVSALDSFGVKTRIVEITRGPAVTRYELAPEAGVRLSRIVNLADDLALNLAAEGVRIEAPIPGKAAVGIEVPNKTVTTVQLRSVVESDTFKNSRSPLSFAIGMDIAGQVRVGDISKMPHLLIAGATGMGKSVCINSMLISLVYKSSPEELQLVLIDPKQVEFTCYAGLPHLYTPIVTDPKKAAGALGAAVGEMTKRYKLFAEYGVRNIEEYNAYLERRRNSAAFAANEGQSPDEEPEKKPRIVIVIDELNDLMMTSPNEVEDYICRLAQMGRAAGIHLVVATQRPSVDVITGTIKNNIPTRIAFKVSSQVDSRTILDSAGAEKLIGRGDMLFLPVGQSKPLRIQGCYVSETEVSQVVAYLKQNAVAQYNEQFIKDTEENAAREKGTKADNSDGSDPMLDEAIEVVVEMKAASTSLLQRKLRLGYSRAARIMDEMESMGIIGPAEGSKPRAVLMTRQQLTERMMARQES